MNELPQFVHFAAEAGDFMFETGDFRFSIYNINFNTQYNVLK
jgi:hypothetical protein